MNYYLWTVHATTTRLSGNQQAQGESLWFSTSDKPQQGSWGGAQSILGKKKERSQGSQQKMRVTLYCFLFSHDFFFFINFMCSPSVQPPLPSMSWIKAVFDTSFKQLSCPVRSTISTTGKPSCLGVSFPFIYWCLCIRILGNNTYTCGFMTAVKEYEDNRNRGRWQGGKLE